MPRFISLKNGIFNEHKRILDISGTFTLDQTYYTSNESLQCTETEKSTYMVAQVLPWQQEVSVTLDTSFIVWKL